MSRITKKRGPIREEVGKRIRQIRVEFGKTQEEFGEPIGVSYGSIARYEKGDVPDLALIAIEYVYRCSKRWILLGQGDKYVKPELAGITAEDVTMIKFLKSTDTSLYKVTIELMQMKLNWDGIERRRGAKKRKH